MFRSKPIVIGASVVLAVLAGGFAAGLLSGAIDVPLAKADTGGSFATCSITLSATSIAPGAPVTLSWNTDGASSFSLDNGIGLVSPVASGSITINPTTSTVYSGTAVNAGGTATAHCAAQVSVSNQPPTCSFVAASTVVEVGGSTTLNWNIPNATSVVIDNGLGSVAASGTQVVTLATSTIYTLTAIGPGGTVHCQTHITCKPPKPSCVLSASPTSIVAGESSKLSWSTQNAVSFAINKNVGTVTPTGSGSTDVTPSTTTTYTGTATGSDGSTATCASTVTVTPPPPAGPTCALSASQTSITDGDSTTLTWSTSNATSVSFVPDIGASASSGTKSVSPDTDTTYTLTAKGNGGTAICKVKVYVAPSCPVPPPTCTLTAAPATIDSGDSSKLSWSTTNTDSFTIDQGVGSVATSSGSKNVSPSTTTTYTGTATGAGGTIHCSTKVTVTPPPPPAPTCTLSASPSSIITGDSTKLSWTTKNATSFSIDHGIGGVTPVASGATTTAPSTTTTYSGTATGAGGTVHCTTKVTVNPPPPPGKGCLLITKETFDPSGTKLTPVAQFSFVLDGVATTTNDANGYAEFDNLTPGIHTVTEVSAGSTWKLLSVTPAGGEVNVPSGSACADVTFKNQQVIPVTPPGPTCTLSAAPTSVQPGSPTTLSWKTTNATSFSIDNGIGSLTPVSNGATSTIPTATSTTYMGTATGAGGTVHCQTTVTLIPPQGVSCTLSASPTTVSAGDHTKLTWSTTNADTFSIDQGIGNVTPANSGSTTSKAITGDTTFTGTAVSPTGKVVTCAVTVTVGGGGGGGGPACTMNVSPSSITSGDSATLSWGGTEISNVDIDNSIATATSSPGSAKVNPSTVGSYTYTGTFHATNGQTLTCSATLTVSGGGGGGGCSGNCGGGGGGGNPPTITLFSHPTTQPLAYLYLSQIPYTGLDLGPWGTALYWIALIGWSFALAYLVLFGAIPFAGKGARTFGMRVAAVLNTEDSSEESVEPEPAHEPVARAALASEPASRYSAYEGFKSFAREGALSVEDIVKGLSRSSAPRAPQTEPVYENVESIYDTVEPIYDSVEPVYESVEPIEAPMPRASQPAPRPPAPAPRQAAPVAPEVPSFIETLISGSREQAFAMLREIMRTTGDAEAFLTQVACALDDAYRARIEGAPVHPEIERICKGCSTPVLERLVTAFTTAVDSSYSTGITGAKLALTRALATVGA